jgi:uncharacterized membrane protein
MRRSGVLWLRPVMKWVLGIAFVFAGANHFIMTPFYLSIMPPYLPWPLELVYLSGFFEMLAGALLLVPRLEAIGAWCIIADSIAVFPANVHMAIHHELFPQFSTTAVWLRLPAQALIIAWAFWFTRPPRAR